MTTRSREAETIIAELAELWRTRDVQVDELVPDRGGALRRPDDAVVDATLHAWSDQIAGEEGHEPASIVLGAVLGEGAMGIVREGVQVALRRSVAVKEVRPSRSTPGNIAALLREAWVSGNLEHPNIVPVHALVAEGGAPRLVMKRIEGIAWSRLLAERASPEDDLERHLGVLVNVCRAVELAHSRGVAHLDLKPANVMLGRFGEVYLVDWGIAAGLDADGPSWLPRASAIARVCGTPAYLAPELAAGDGSRVDARTDVYGLGAILHEVLTGEVRHAGTTVREVLVAAFESAPVDYGPRVPRGLAAIANRATARDPAARHPDAESFRVAIDDFILYRSAARLTDDALARLERLAVLIAAEPAATRTPASEATLERLFIECRYGFEQALAQRPDDDDARAGKRRLLELGIDDALAGLHWQRAAAYLAELDEPSPERAARIEAVQHELAQRERSRKELERLGHETDGNYNRRTRSRFAAAAGITWIVWNGTAAWLVKGPLAPLQWSVLIANVVATMVLGAVGLWLFRRSLLTTALNRHILGLFVIGFVLVLLSILGGWVADADPHATVAQTFPLYLSYCLTLAAFVDRRSVIAGILVAPFTIVGPAHPEIAFEMVAAVGGIAGFTLAWLWRKPIRSPFLGTRAPPD